MTGIRSKERQLEPASTFVEIRLYVSAPMAGLSRLRPKQSGTRDHATVIDAYALPWKSRIVDSVMVLGRGACAA